MLGLILVVSVFGIAILAGASDNAQGGSSPAETKDPFAGSPDLGVVAPSAAVAAGAPERAGELSVRWRAPRPGTLPLVGRWVTRDALYLGANTGVLRYSSQDGAARAIPLPQANAELAGMSADPTGSLGAVAWIVNRQMHVSVIDLATDQVRFSVPVSGAALSWTRPVRLAVGDSMVVAVVGAMVHALDIRDGQALWTWDSASSRRPVSGITGVLVDDKNVLLSGEVRDERAGVGISLRAADGVPAWEEVVTRTPTRNVSVVNVDPPTFFVTSEDRKTRTLAVTNDRGQLAHLIRCEPDDDDALPNLETIGIGEFGYERPVLIVDGVFYTRTALDAEGNGVTAVDLRTGKARWRTLLPDVPGGGPGRLFLAGSTEGEVFVVAADDYAASQGLVVWRLSKADGVLVKHAAGASIPIDLGGTYGWSFTWTGGDLYAVKDFNPNVAVKIGF